MTAQRDDPTPVFKNEARHAARFDERYSISTQEKPMTTLDELREVLVGITSELAGVNISTDGEIVRRIGSLIVEARELIGQIEVESEVRECQREGD